MVFVIYPVVVSTLSLKTVSNVFAYGEKLASNVEPIFDSDKDKESGDESNEVMSDSEDYPLLQDKAPHHTLNDENTGSVIVHSNEDAAFDKSNVHLVTTKKNKKRSLSKLFLSCFGRCN